MNDHVEKCKTTVREHPTETAAVVGVVAVLGTIFYFKSKEKKTKRNAPCNCSSDKIGWFSRWLEYRKTRLELQIASLR